MTDLVLLAQSDEGRVWWARPGTVRVDAIYKYVDGDTIKYRITDQYGGRTTFRLEDLTPEGRKLVEGITTEGEG